MTRNVQSSSVVSAYKPSGKISARTIPIMVVFGIVCSIMTGYILARYYPEAGNGVWNYKLAGSRNEFLNDFYFFIGRFIVEFLTALFFLIPLTPLIFASRIGKNRNERVATITGALTGIAAVLIYLVYAVQETLLIPKIIVILFILVASILFSGAGASIFPFCEEHDRYMKKQKIHSFPIAVGAEAMKLLTARDFKRLIELPSIKTNGSHSVITLYFCNICFNGVIEMETIIESYTQQRAKKIDRHLVFSSLLDGSESKEILSVYEGKQKYLSN